MTNMIRIDSKYHAQLRLNAFDKHISIQGELNEILQQHFDTQGTQHDR